MKSIFITLFCFLTFSISAQTESWKALSSTGEVLERHENALTRVGNKILLIGGRGQKPVNIYDIPTQQWKNGEQPPMEIHHMQAVSLDGLVYILGGFTGSWPHETPLANVLIYDVFTDDWTIGPDIPMDRRRGAAGVAVYDDKIYLVNGIINGHTSGWVNWLDEFNPYTGEWKILPDAPVARDHFQAVVIDDKMYVAGGRRSGSVEDSGFAGTVSSTNVFDFSTGTWETYPDIPTPRAGTAAIVSNGNPVILGGESDRQEKAHSEVEMLNLETKIWENLPPMNEGRHGTQAVNLDGNIIIGAGSGNRGGGPELNSFEVYATSGKIKSGADPITRGDLSASVEHLDLTPGSSGRKVTVSNTGGNSALFINYLQTDKPEFFEVITSRQTPIILAPGAKFTVEVKAKDNVPKEASGSLFIKPPGGAAPIEISLRTK